MNIVTFSGWDVAVIFKLKYFIESFNLCFRMYKWFNYKYVQFVHIVKPNVISNVFNLNKHFFFSSFSLFSHRSLMFYLNIGWLPLLAMTLSAPVGFSDANSDNIFLLLIPWFPEGTLPITLRKYAWNQRLARMQIINEILAPEPTPDTKFNQSRQFGRRGTFRERE